MKIISWPLGPFETNGYFFMHRGMGFLVDPGDPEIADFLNEIERVDWILLTHGHVDHVLGIDAVKRRFPQARIALSAQDRTWYEKSDLQAAMFGLQRQPVPDPDLWLSPPCEIEGIQVLATPGHTPGGVCYFLPEEGELFSGDTLFAGGVGRTDFPGGSWSRLEESIRRLYRDLPPGTHVHPGHGPATTLGEERRSNPFISDRL